MQAAAHITPQIMKNKLTLTTEERKINQAIDRGEYSSTFSKVDQKKYQATAKYTFAKQKAVNVRISERNLMRLKAAAAREGVSYQTLITSLIQKNV